MISHNLLVLFIFSFCLIPAITNSTNIYKSNVLSLSARLHPQQDIMTTLTQLLKIEISSTYLSSKAFTISSAVGSVLHCHIRFANNSYLTKVQGPLQITSLSGTFDQNLAPHIHISVADGNGRTYGGHLPSLQQRKQKGLNLETYNCPIFTTLQISLLIHTDLIYKRQIDPETTFDQLTIHRKKPIEEKPSITELI